MTGRIVSEIKAVTNQKFVIGAELENGVYIINATTQDGTKSVFRIVKQ
jgi:nitrogen fixation protein FixH